jgi:hypothetical protein
MSPAGFEPVIAASERPQTQALESGTIGPFIKFRRVSSEDDFMFLLQGQVCSFKHVHDMIKWHRFGSSGRIMPMQK